MVDPGADPVRKAVILLVLAGIALIVGGLAVEYLPGQNGQDHDDDPGMCRSTYTGDMYPCPPNSTNGTVTR